MSIFANMVWSMARCGIRTQFTDFIGMEALWPGTGVSTLGVMPTEGAPGGGGASKGGGGTNSHVST